LGREHVCAFFTWPASASGNPLISYTSTTEAAAYALNHLKKTLRMIGEMPGVEGVHVLAHSRGAGLTMDALSALGNEYQLRGETFFSALPLRNVLLLSPDLDTDIAAQRISVGLSDPDLVPTWSAPRDTGDEAELGFRFTVYASPKDRALLLSRILFRSYRRVGRAGPEDMSEEMQEVLAKWGRFDLIIYEGERSDAFGHSFFTSNPLVSSDLVQLIRFARRPGDPGRPLRQVGPVTWVFENQQ
jgi:esterase/lipase superfamily enzyme